MKIEEIAESPQPEHCPWSRKSIRRLGEHLKDGTRPKSGDPTLEQYIGWHTGIVGFIWAALEVHDWSDILDENCSPEITGRPKTDQTLTEKLQRDHSFGLHMIQDVSGVRFEARMKLSQQDAVVERVREIFERCDWDVRITDHRSGEHTSGYRAVHLLIERRSDKARAEIQVRTLLQGRWANLYETLADIYGRGIRYGELPTDPRERKDVEHWQMVSRDLVARFEKIQNEHRSGLADNTELTQLKIEIESVHDNIDSMIQQAWAQLRDKHSELG